MAVEQELAHWRHRLQTRKAELQGLIELSRNERATVALDQQSVGRLSRMDALQRQAMADAQQRSRTAEITRIDQALRRIDEDEYGYCLTCGEAIPMERLEIDAAASHCITCAR